MNLDKVVSSMDAFDAKHNSGFLSDIHVDFKEKASTIPYLWEHNERTLRYLVSVSNLILTVGILEDEASEKCSDYSP